MSTPEPLAGAAREQRASSGTAEPREGRSGPKGLIFRYLERFDDGELMRWSFRGLLAGALGVLALDLYGMVQSDFRPAPGSPAEMMRPVLPPAVRTDGDSGSPADPRRHVTSDESLLRQPMVFELLGDGVLLARGNIDLGAAARFSAEVDARGEYVKTVRLDSPGGSLEDAMAMARLVRDRGFTTEIAEGALCASSCPLVFAGGVTRRAAPDSAVGLHQFFAASEAVGEPAQIMADAQMTTARISRHLVDMGVDPALWLHALDTPPRALYYLSADEMQRYRLVTSSATARAD